ncbi:MAG: acyltransferase family protein, partial [Pseudomonadota bacterium]
MTQPKMPQQRLAHIDAAKGVSIFLVVYWHAVDDRLVFNEALWMLRMPLFFFVSGLFAAKALELDWRAFLSNKVGNILYLYVFWTF